MQRKISVRFFFYSQIAELAWFHWAISPCSGRPQGKERCCKATHEICKTWIPLMNLLMPLTSKLSPESRTRAFLISRDEPKNEMSILSMLFCTLLFYHYIKMLACFTEQNSSCNFQYHKRNCTVAYSCTAKEDHVYNDQSLKAVYQGLLPYSLHPIKLKVLSIGETWWSKPRGGTQERSKE